MDFKHAHRGRPGIAEVVGSVITVALTIMVGVAVFTYVRGEAAVSENQYGQSVGQTVSNLEESFVVAQLNFNYPSSCTAPCKSTSVTIYFYNDGRVANQFQQVQVYNSTTGTTKFSFSFTGSYVTDQNNAGSCNVQATTSYESTLLGSASSSFSVSIGAMNSVTLTLPTSSACYVPGKGVPYNFVQGDTYFVKVLGIYGNSVTYYQVM